MNCERYEQWIALSISEDLSPRRAARLEAHLAECASCQTLVEGLARSRALLRQPEERPIGDPALARVQARTMSALEEGRREHVPRSLWPTGRLALPMAALFVLVVALAALWLNRQWTIAPPRAPDTQARVMPPKQVPPALPQPAQASVTASSASPAPLAPSQESSAIRIPRAQPSAGKASQMTEGKPLPPMLILLETDDPQVVIYWLVDEKPTSKREVSHG